MYVWNLLESKFEERGVILKSFQERRFRQHALLRAWCGFSAARGTSWGLRRRLYNHSAAMLPLVEAGFRVPWAIWISIANVTIQQDARRILFSKYVCMYIYIYIVHIYIYIFIYTLYIYIYIILYICVCTFGVAAWKRETQQKTIAIGILEWFGPHIENQNGLKLSKSGLGRWPCGRVFFCCWTCPLAKGGASRREMPKSIGTQKRLRVKTKACPLVN